MTHAIIHATSQWEELAGPGWRERIMSEKVTDRYHAKQGRSIGRWTLTHAGQTLTVYLKRHEILPRLSGLAARFFPGKAWSPGLQEYHHLDWARSIGLPVPHVSAVGELRGPGCRLQSFLAVDELTGMLALHEAIPLAHQRLSYSDFQLWKRGLVREIARLTAELHRRWHYHQDLYLCHFYLNESDTAQIPKTWKLVMIDFHRLKKARFLSTRYRIKDLAQLLYSSYDVAGITDRDRLQFWREYKRQEWSDAGVPRSRLFSAALRKSRFYHRHNLRKQGLPK